jgi:hypothetical protein
MGVSSEEKWAQEKLLCQGQEAIVQTHPLVREGAQHQETRNCQRENKNLVIGSRREPETKTRWSTDRRSYRNLPSTLSHYLQLRSVSVQYFRLQIQTSIYSHSYNKIKHFSVFVTCPSILNHFALKTVLFRRIIGNTWSSSFSCVALREAPNN